MREVFAAGLATNIADQGIPRGLARAVDGGHMVRGDWRYGSGIYHANLIHSGCVLVDEGATCVGREGCS